MGRWEVVVGARRGARQGFRGKPVSRMVLSLVVSAVGLYTLGCTPSETVPPWAETSAPVTGRVAVPDGVDASSVSVWLDGSVVGVLGDDGTFSLGSVAVGSHEMEAEAFSFRYQAQRTFEVTDTTPLKVDLDLRAASGVGSTVGSLGPADLPVGMNISVQDVAGEGGTVVLCNNPSNAQGIVVVDASDPETPVFLSVSGDARAVAAARVRGSYVFAGWWQSWPRGGGITIYSLSDPSAPTVVSEVVSAEGNRVYAVELAEDFLYAFGDRFEIFNVSDAAHPALVSSVEGLSGEGLVFRAGYVYLSDETNVLVVVDVKDASNPEVVWVSDDTGNGSRDIAIDEDALFVASGDAVYQYDIHDPAAPTLTNVLGAAELVSMGVALNRGTLALEGVEAWDRQVYLGAIWDGLVAIDYSDRVHPVVGWQSDGQVPFAMNAYISPPYAFVAAKDEALRVVRIK